VTSHCLLDSRMLIYLILILLWYIWQLLQDTVTSHSAIVKEAPGIEGDWFLFSFRGMRVD